MRKMFSMLALLCIAVTTFSQPTDDGTGTTPPPDIEGERRRIQAERTLEEAHFGQEEAACYARFAVTDCLRQVRVLRRDVFDGLRRQEILLNDVERKRKAQEQIERIKEKSKPLPKLP